MHIAVGLLASAISFLALASPAFAADLAEIRERGALRVAVSPLSPFVVKAEDGTFSGFEIDATRALAERLGVGVEYVETPFCALADAIVEGTADVVASGYSNIESRRQVLGFSLPYHDTEYVLVLSKAAAKRAKTLRGVNRQDISIGFQQGGVSGEIARAEFSGASLQAYSSFAEIMAALETGDIEGAVLFAPYDRMARKIKNRKYVVPHEFPLTRTIEAFAMSPDADELRDAVNEWIIERDLQGFWDELERKWFDPATMTIGATPAERCKALTPTG